MFTLESFIRMVEGNFTKEELEIIKDVMKKEIIELKNKKSTFLQLVGKKQSAHTSDENVILMAIVEKGLTKNNFAIVFPAVAAYITREEGLVDFIQFQGEEENVKEENISRNRTSKRNRRNNTGSSGLES